MKEQNAKIDSVTIEIEDHNVLTAFLYLGFNHAVQAFGGYNLDSSFCADFIRRVLLTVGVDKWEQLPGKIIRTRSDNNDKLLAIGNAIEDKWFNPEEFYKSHYEQKL